MSDKPHIAIIGLGLIGGSMARALKKYDLAAHISGTARSDKTRARALELGFVDSVHDNLPSACADADIVVLCTPLNTTRTIIEVIAPVLKDNAIITDVGSAKSCVIADAAPYLQGRLHLVPAHPIAGTEQSGPDAGFAELFQNRWCILTPSKETSLIAVEEVARLWRGMGSEIAFMEAEAHDMVLALTSHVPHLIAYALVHMAVDLERDMGDDIIRYSAGGFRDFTRITASDPTMWRDVFLRNKQATLTMLARFGDKLTAMEQAIRHEDGAALEDIFNHARDMRPRIVAAGQDTPLPDFGRNPEGDKGD